MTTTKRTPKRTEEKRGQGRPVVGENDVGKERLLVAAEKLLRELPPARVTIALIAKTASADPALVRYYFGNRTALLLAVADRMTRNASHTAKLSAAPDVALAEHIRRTLKFTRSAPFMHRLMIEELADMGNEESRAKVRTMNLDLVAFYRRFAAIRREDLMTAWGIKKDRQKFYLGFCDNPPPEKRLPRFHPRQPTLKT